MLQRSALWGGLQRDDCGFELGSINECGLVGTEERAKHLAIVSGRE